MKIAKRFVQYIGLGIFFLGLIIVYGTLRANAFNAYMLLAGLTLIIIPVVIYLIYAWIISRDTSSFKYLKDLKHHGFKIRVDLTRCRVKSNSWSAEVERYQSPRVVFLNEISGHGDKNIERIESTLSRIEYTCDVNGRPRTFTSLPIDKDNVTLRILLEMQKETTIYIDRQNANSYYFDLEFLNEDSHVPV